MDDIERLRVEQLHAVLCHGSPCDRPELLELDDEDLLVALGSPDSLQRLARRRLFDKQLYDNDEPTYALRTPPSRRKYQGRQGARTVRVMEQQSAEKSAPRSPEGQDTEPPMFFCFKSVACPMC